MIDHTIMELREKGLRVTPQREAILRLLEGNHAHPSAESIYQEILKKYPRISFATVYNNLSKLARAEKIQELDIDPNKKRYDPCMASHPHFYCEVCGKVFHIADDIYVSSNNGLLNIHNVDGHKVESIQIDLKGVCKDCGHKPMAGARGGGLRRFIKEDKG